MDDSLVHWQAPITPTTVNLSSQSLSFTGLDTFSQFWISRDALPCPSAINLTSTTHDASSGIIEYTAALSNGKITASNKLSGDVRVQYKGSVIELKEHFEANSGTVFIAQPGGCVD